ncbi:MAG: hypothetical protein J6K42_06155 [Clostridia bacterium]|nr:hypothetical protein [Clostridia bacterium]
MTTKKEWLQMNIEELQKRTVVISYFSEGNIIHLSEETKPSIDLVLCTPKQSYRILKHSIIDYKKLRSASTLEKRLRIVVDALREVNIQFYFDKQIVDLIIYGI